jgi:hypothetical protein
MIELAFAAFVAFNVLDAGLTLNILKRGGRERNPLLRWLSTRLSPLSAMVLLKGAAIIAVGYFLNSLPVPLVVAFALAYLVVCLRNALVLRGMKS